MFKDNLAALRKREHLTQAELAQKLHIAQSTLASYERGIREPNFDMLQRIADFFGITPSELMDVNYKSGMRSYDEALHSLGEMMQATVKHNVEPLVSPIPALSPQKQKALEMIDKMSEDELRRFIAMGKLMLGEE